MSQNIEIWNLLHDGIITIFAGEDKNTLTIFVHIPYLRRRIKPAGVSFILKLHGVKICTFRDFDGKEEPLSEAFESNTPEILNTESKSMPVVLNTTLGNLTLEYESIKYFLDSGAEIDYQVIFKTCSEYWQEWRSKNQA